MKTFTAALFWLASVTGAFAACLPSQATVGMVGCQPVAASMLGSDLVEVWLPGSFPNALQIITRNNMLAGSTITGATLAGGVLSGTFTGNATLSGNLTLSGNIAIGGTLAVTGATTLSKTLAVTGAYSTAGNNLVVTTFTVDQALADSSVNPTLNVTNILASSAGKELWVNFDSIVYNVSGGDSATGGNIVGRYVGLQRQAAAPNVPFDGLIVGLSDTTGLATSLSGGLYGVEIDLSANGNDDSGSQLRRGLWIALGKSLNASAAPQASIGIGIISGSGTPFSGSDGLGFFIPISIQTPFLTAGIDLRSAPNMSGGTGHALWLRTGQTIAFDTTGAASASVVNLSSVFNASIGANVLVSATAIQLTSTAAANINTDNTHGVFTFGQPLRIPGYAAASLPSVGSASQGAIAFCNNCTNLNESSGSGVIVTQNTAGAWVTPWGATASASTSALAIQGTETVTGLTTLNGGTVIGGISGGKGINVTTAFTTAGIDLSGSTQTSGAALRLGDGKFIAFDTSNTSHAYWDTAIFTAAGGVHLAGNGLQVDTQLYTPGTLTVGGLTTLAGTVGISTNAALNFSNQITGAGAFTGTLTNAPKASDPDFWLPVTINATQGWIPWWHS